MAGTITTRQTIILKGDISEGYREYISAADNILPGMLLQVNVDGKVIKNAEAAKKAEVLIAIEDDFLGMSITGARPDTTNLGYMTGDVVRCKIFEPGEVALMILLTGENADASEYLSPDGTGKLKVVVTTDFRMFKTVDAVDATSADKRIAAQVM